MKRKNFKKALVASMGALMVAGSTVSVKAANVPIQLPQNHGTNTNTGDEPIVNVPGMHPSISFINEKTIWKEVGTETVLKAEETGNLSDNDGVSDIANYNYIRTEKSETTLVGEALPENKSDRRKLTEEEKQRAINMKLLEADNADMATYGGEYEIVYTNYYEKQKNEIQVENHVTKWVKQYLETDLKAQEKGTFPDDDGNSDINGYVLVETRTEQQTTEMRVPRQATAEEAAEHNKPFGPETVVTSETTHYTINIYKEPSYVTKWLEEGTDKVLKPESDQELPDTEGDDVDGYVFVRTTASTENGVTTTTNYYKLKTVRTNWHLEDGSEIKPSEEINAPDTEGDDIENHVLVSTKTEEINGETVVTNIYKKKTVETNWIEKDTNKVLQEKSDTDAPDNDNVSDIAGYRFVETTVSEENAHKVVTNIYERIPLVTTKWENENGISIKDSETGETPNNNKEIPGYTYVETTTENHDNGDSTVTHIFRKNTVVTKWVDTNGDELKPQEDGEHPDNDEISDVENYTFVRVTDETENGNRVITNIYAKNTVVTKWILEDGTELKSPVEEALPDVEGDDIPEYVLVNTTDETNAGNRVVTNIYKEKTTTTFWKDEEGTELAPSKKGNFPDNDGVTDVKGYEIVKIAMKEENGDTTITNIYKKVAVEEEPKVETQVPTDYPTVDLPALNTRVTMWLERGTAEVLKPEEFGEHPDKEGDDIPGYKFIETIEMGEDKDIVNIYVKEETPEQPKEEPKEQPKQEPKKEQEQPKEQPKDEPKVEQPKVEKSNNVKDPVPTVDATNIFGLLGAMGASLLGMFKRKED